MQLFFIVQGMSQAVIFDSEGALLMGGMKGEREG